MKRLVGVILATTVLLTGCSESTDGAVLYRKYCAACHGSDLSGNVGPSLAAGSEAAASTDAEYRIVILEGLNDMPAASGLDELRVDAVVTYLRQVQAQ
jgi:mono/diheme cytochrome c family protein